MRSDCDGAARFERHDCSCRTILDIELGKSMFDVFADDRCLCAENYADVMVAFAL